MIRSVLLILVFFMSSCFAQDDYVKGLPLYYYQFTSFVNFGDYLSLKIVERILGGQVRVVKSRYAKEKKLLALGSILPCANDGDVLWGTGMNGKVTDISKFRFKNLEVKAVRGPLTREFLMTNFGISCPEVYGDPALLIPYFFPEFKKSKQPKHEYLILPHYTETYLFPKNEYPNVIYPTDSWRDVIRAILDSKFVITSSLHGIVIAEAFGIPARFLRLGDYEPLFKYQDYYLGTGRTSFQYATSVEEALEMGGMPPIKCDLKKLYESFPFSYWPEVDFFHPDFKVKP